MREVYIFDIDGCIMPPIFTNFNNNDPRKKIVEDIIKNGNQVELFASFIEFYKTHCNQTKLIYFITGRKYSEFGNLTENQLQILSNFKNFKVVYYPERKKHKIQKYFAWKIKILRDIIKSNLISKDFNVNTEEKVKFHIFDDMNDYFSKIRKFENKWPIQIDLTTIDSENNWYHLL